jgi:hypothetical protein
MLRRLRSLAMSSTPVALGVLPNVTKGAQPLRLRMASSSFLAIPIPLVERFHNQGSTVHYDMVLWFSECSGLRGAVMQSPSVEVPEELTRAMTQRAILSTPTMGV